VLGLAVEVGLEVEDPRGLAHAGDALLLLDALLLEREAHVLGDAQLRIQRVVLEDHGDVAVARAHVGDVAVADADRAGIERLEAGEHAQRRRLARARRPDEHEQLAVADVEVEAVDRGDLRPLVDARGVVVSDRGHPGLLT
jgi:hypothetical protein